MIKPTLHRRPRIAFILPLLLLTVVAAPSSLVAADEKPRAKKFQSLFDGKTLKGWRGDPKLWRVEDGAITGQTTAEVPTKRNTFLIWEGGEVADFELQAKIRVIGNNNSGIQYRSKDRGDFRVTGYQCDIHPAPKYVGMLYEEGGRGITAQRGQKVVVDDKGKKNVVGVTGEATPIKIDEWTEYTIIARGNELIHKVNGKVSVHVTDNQPAKRAMKGILALQLHAGRPMKVQIKDIRLKKLKGKDKTASPPTAGIQATPADKITLLPGFKAELLYSVPKKQQGSWVSLTVDPKGRLIASDQGSGAYRITPPPIGGEPQDTRVEPLAVKTGGAQGMCFVGDDLYMVVTHGDSGLFRLRDTDGDDQFDEVTKLRAIQGKGEHGPHGVIPGPDGKSLYVVAGNHTRLPEPEKSRVPQVWDEDLLLGRQWDARGHARGVTAPGGWVCKTDLEGKTWEVFAIGFRNAYDIALNRRGDLFTYDSDMEWDHGTSWYRPTRCYHVPSGADFGWRSGTGKWPPYYTDTLPPLIDVGPGSPTGVVFGYGAKFPPRYQEALFICDWSYGKLYAVHLKPHASSYKTEHEQFLAAAPMALTDIIINPHDGAMYFTTGGRNTQSGLYRITHEEAPAAVTPPQTPRGSYAGARLNLERLHTQPDPEELDGAIQLMMCGDRFVANAARVAVEHYPVEQWQEKALALDPRSQSRTIRGMVALARQADKEIQPRVLEKLNAIDWSKANEQRKLELLRAYQLAFIRMGKPDAAAAKQVAGRLNPHYPADSEALNRELAMVLIYLEAKGVVDKTLDLLAKAPTQEEQIHYAFALRNLKAGWTLKQRKQYFAWFNKAGAFRGGASFGGFVKNIKAEAVNTLSATEKESLAEMLKQAPPPSITLPIPKGPGKVWTVDDLAPLAEAGLRGRDFANGKQMFSAGLCFMCHRFNDIGGAVGPDLTSVGNRFSPRDLLESAIEPSKTISDQYGATEFHMADGKVIIGRIANLSGDTYRVSTNMLDSQALTGVNAKQVKLTRPSPVSMMPQNLLNAMNQDEVLDLLAYLISGGNPEHDMFKN